MVLVAVYQPAPPVLVIPGLDGNPALWQDVADTALVGLQPLWFDHSADRAEDGLEGLARRALAVLDAATSGTGAAYVCGESFGGPVALTLARRYPERVRGLLLFSTFAHHPARLTLGLGVAASRLLSDALTRRFLALTHPLTLAQALGSDAPWHVRRTYLRRALGDVAAYRAKCELALHFDARPWLHEVHVPTLILAGSDDTVVPRSAGERLAAGLPRVRFHVIPGRHLAWCERASHVGTLVGDWLSVSGCPSAVPSADPRDSSPLAASRP